MMQPDLGLSHTCLPDIVLTVDAYRMRVPRASDAAGLCTLVRSDRMRHFLGGGEYSEPDQFQRLQRNAGSWALYGYGTFVVEDASGALVGNAGVFHSFRGLGRDFDDQPEAGWIIGEDYWGRGLATQLMRTALAWFDATHGPRRVVAMIAQGHGASDAVAHKLGFVPFRTGQMPGDDNIVQLYERMPA